MVHLDFSFGAGLTADRADRVTSVHVDQFLIQTEYTFVPGADVDVVVDIGPHVLEVHDLIPESGWRATRGEEDVTQ